MSGNRAKHASKQQRKGRSGSAGVGKALVFFVVATVAVFGMLDLIDGGGFDRIASLLTGRAANVPAAAGEEGAPASTQAPAEGSASTASEAAPGQASAEGGGAGAASDSGSSSRPAESSQSDSGAAATGKQGSSKESAQGKPANRRGIDVSELQGEIDWKAVAADGIEFAFVRVGYRGSSEGGLFEDERYKSNLAGAQAAGIDCGAYFYSQAIDVNEAKAEAEFVAKALAGRKLEYPVAFDYEVLTSGHTTRAAGVDPETAVAIAKTFCAEIEKAGYDTLIYGNIHDLEHFQHDQLKGIPIWYAEYSESPSHNVDYAFWQYSCTGLVSGIATEVDLNIDVRPQGSDNAKA